MELKALSQEKKEKEEFEKILERGDLKRLREIKDKTPFHPRIDEINRRINEMSPTSYPDRYKNIDLKKLLKEVPRWIKKKNVNIDDFEKELYSDFERALSDELSSKRKRWKDFGDKNTWGKISNIIGVSNAKSLFNKLIEE